MLSSHLEKWILVDEKQLTVSDWGLSAQNVRIQSACLDAMSLPVTAEGEGLAKTVGVEWISKSAFRITLSDVVIRVRPRTTEADWDDETSAKVKHVLLQERLQQWEIARDKEEALEEAARRNKNDADQKEQEEQQGDNRTKKDNDTKKRAGRMQAVAHALVTNLHVLVNNLQLVYVDPWKGETTRVVVGNLSLERDLDMELDMPGRLCKEATLEGLSLHVLGAENQLHELVTPVNALAKFSYIDPWKRGQGKDQPEDSLNSQKKALPAKSLMLDIQKGQVVADKAQAAILAHVSDVMLHHRPYRPLRRPLASADAPSAWWQYSVRLVLDEIRRRKAWWNPKEMVERKAAEEKYIQAYNTPKVQGKVPEEIQKQLEKLEAGRTYEQIVYWRSQARKKRAEQKSSKDSYQEEVEYTGASVAFDEGKALSLPEKDSRSWWDWVTGKSKAVDSGVFTEDEIQEVLEALGETADQVEGEEEKSRGIDSPFDATDFEDTDEALDLTLELKISSGAVQLLDEKRNNQVVSMAMEGGKVLVQIKPSQTMLVLQLSGVWMRDSYGAMILRYPAEHVSDRLSSIPASFQLLTNWSSYPAKVDIKVKTASVKFSLSPSFEQHLFGFFSQHPESGSDQQVESPEEDDSTALGPVMSFLGVVGSVKINAEVEGPQLYLPERHGMAAVSLGVSDVSQHNVLVYKMGHLQLETDVVEGKPSLQGVSKFLNRYRLGIRGMSVLLCQFSTKELAELGSCTGPATGLFHMNVASTSTLTLPVHATEENAGKDTNFNATVRFQDAKFACSLSEAQESAVIVSTWASSYWREPPVPVTSHWKRKLEGYLLVRKGSAEWKWKWVVLHGHKLEFLHYQHSESVESVVDLMHVELGQEELSDDLPVISLEPDFHLPGSDIAESKRVSVFAGKEVHRKWFEQLQNSQNKALIKKSRRSSGKKIVDQVTKIAEAYKQAHEPTEGEDKEIAARSRKKHTERVFVFALNVELKNVSVELKMKDEEAHSVSPYSFAKLSLSGARFSTTGSMPGSIQSNFQIMSMSVTAFKDQQEIAIFGIAAEDKPALSTTSSSTIDDKTGGNFSLGNISLRVSPQVLETAFLVQKVVASTWFGDDKSLSAFKVNQLAVSKLRSKHGLIIRMIGMPESHRVPSNNSSLREGAFYTDVMESPLQATKSKRENDCMVLSCDLACAKTLSNYASNQHQVSSSTQKNTKQQSAPPHIAFAVESLELLLFDKYDNKLSGITANGVFGTTGSTGTDGSVTHVEMDSFSVFDASPQGKLHRDVVKTGDIADRAFVLDYRTFDPMNIMFPGYGSSVHMILKNPRIVALMRFVQDAFLNARWLPARNADLESLSSVDGQDSQTSKALAMLNVRKRKMNTRVELIDPCLQIPRCSTSKELLEVSLARLSATNSFSIDGACVEHKDTKGLSGIETLERDAFVAEDEGQCMQQWSISLEGCHINTKCTEVSSLLSSMFDLSVDVNIPFLPAGATPPSSVTSMSILAAVPSIRLCASDFQLNLLLGILGGNLAEQSIFVGDEQVAASKIPNLEHGLSSLMSHKLQGPEKTASWPAQMVFSLQVADLELDALLASGLEDCDPFQLAKIQCEVFSLKFVNFKEDLSVDNTTILSRCDTTMKTLKILNTIGSEASQQASVAVKFEHIEGDSPTSHALSIFMEKQSLNKHTIIGVQFAEPTMEGHKGFLLSILGYLGSAFSGAPCPTSFSPEEQEVLRYGNEAPNIVSGLSIKLMLPSCKIFIPCGPEQGFLAKGDVTAAYCSLLEEVLLDASLRGLSLRGASRDIILGSFTGKSVEDKGTRDIVSPFTVEFAWKGGSATMGKRVQKYTLSISPVRLMVSYEDFVLLATAAKLISKQQKVSKRDAISETSNPSHSALLVEDTISATISLQGSQMIIIDDFGNKWIPLARISFHYLNAQVSSGNSTTNVYVDLSMQVETYEYYLARWSIFLEPWNFEAKLQMEPVSKGKSQEDGQNHLQSFLQLESNRASFKISSTFLNTLSLVARSWSKDQRLVAVFSDEKVALDRPPTLEMSNNKQFYPFIIRNLTASNLGCSIRGSRFPLAGRSELKLNYSEVYGIDDLHSLESLSSVQPPLSAAGSLFFDGCQSIENVRLDRVGSQVYFLSSSLDSEEWHQQDVLSGITLKTIVENGCMVTCILPHLVLTNLTSTALCGALVQIGNTEEVDLPIESVEVLGTFQPGECLPFPILPNTDKMLCILPAELCSTLKSQDWIHGKFLELSRVKEKNLPNSFSHRMPASDTDSFQIKPVHFSVNLKASPSDVAFKFFDANAYMSWELSCFMNPCPEQENPEGALQDVHKCQTVTLELTSPILLCNALPQEVGIELLGLPVPPEKVKARVLGGRTLLNDMNPQSASTTLQSGEIISINEVETFRNLFLRFCLASTGAESSWSNFAPMPLEKAEQTLSVASSDHPHGLLYVNLSVDYHHEHNTVIAKIWSSFWIVNMCGFPLECHMQNQNADVAALLDQEWQGGKEAAEASLGANSQSFVTQPLERPSIVSEFQPIGSSLDIALRMAGSCNAFSSILTNDSLSVGPKLVYTHPIHIALALSRPERNIFKDTQVFVLSPQCIVHNATGEELKVWQLDVGNGSDLHAGENRKAIADSETSSFSPLLPSLPSNSAEPCYIEGELAQARLAVSKLDGQPSVPFSPYDTGSVLVRLPVEGKDMPNWPKYQVVLESPGDSATQIVHVQEFTSQCRSMYRISNHSSISLAFCQDLAFGSEVEVVEPQSQVDIVWQDPCADPTLRVWPCQWQFGSSRPSIVALIDMHNLEAETTKLQAGRAQGSQLELRVVPEKGSFVLEINGPVSPTGELLKENPDGSKTAVAAPQEFGSFLVMAKVESVRLELLMERPQARKQVESSGQHLYPVLHTELGSVQLSCDTRKKRRIMQALIGRLQIEHRSVRTQYPVIASSKSGTGGILRIAVEQKLKESDPGGTALFKLISLRFPDLDVAIDEKGIARLRFIAESWSQGLAWDTDENADFADHGVMPQVALELRQRLASDFSKDMGAQFMEDRFAEYVYVEDLRIERSSVVLSVQMRGLSADDVSLALPSVRVQRALRPPFQLMSTVLSECRQAATEKYWELAAAFVRGGMRRAARQLLGRTSSRPGEESRLAATTPPKRRFSFFRRS